MSFIKFSCGIVLALALSNGPNAIFGIRIRGKKNSDERRLRKREDQEVSSAFRKANHSSNDNDARVDVPGANGVASSKGGADGVQGTKVENEAVPDVESDRAADVESVAVDRAAADQKSWERFFEENYSLADAFAAAHAELDELEQNYLPREAAHTGWVTREEAEGAVRAALEAQQHPNLLRKHDFPPLTRQAAAQENQPQPSWNVESRPYSRSVHGGHQRPLLSNANGPIYDVPVYDNDDLEDPPGTSLPTENDIFYRNRRAMEVEAF